MRESVPARFTQEVALSSSTASRCKAARSAACGAFSRPRPAGLPAFYQMLTLAGTPPARRWEPKTVRLPLMSVPAVIARRTVLRYKAAPRPASS